VLNGPPNPPISLTFNGSKLKNFPSDEIRLARLFQTFLDPQRATHIEGISLESKSFLEVAHELAQHGWVFLLGENFPPFETYLKGLNHKKSEIKSLSFILSDNIDLEKQEEERLIKELDAKPISLGTKSYLASHCIIFLLIELNRLHFFNNLEG